MSSEDSLQLVGLRELGGAGKTSALGRRASYIMDDSSLDDLLGSLAPATAATASGASIAPLVVRVHRLTVAQAERVCKWAAALDRVDVLADVTLDAGVAAVALLRRHIERACLASRVRIIEFVSRDMERLYPRLRDPALERYRQIHMWMMPALSHAWAYTAEALVVGGLGLNVSRYAPAQHTWVFEHDCDFAGPIEDLLSAYADDDADLIAKEMIPPDKLREWMWIDCATPQFLAKYGPQRAVAHVHAVRISTRLLHALHEAAVEGRIGYGEMALPTVCVGEGLTWRQLREEHVGQPYDPQGFMDQKTFEFLSHVPARKLVHALKW